MRLAVARADFVLVVGCFINWRTELNSPVKLWKVSLYDSLNRSVNNTNRFFLPWEEASSLNTMSSNFLFSQRFLEVFIRAEPFHGSQSC